MRTPILSFCIPVMNRLSDIKATLRQNLNDNELDRHLIEFIVVSFDSDNTTTDWITDQFDEELKTGYLKYHHSKSLPSWHFGKAKNSFRQLMNGKVYASLDGDNYTGYRGGRHIIEVFEEHDYNCVFHQFQGDWGDGTCGRVSMTAEDYKTIGYDDSFLPRQWDELDAMLSVLNRKRDRTYVCYQGKSIFAKSKPFNRFFLDHEITPKTKELPADQDPLFSRIGEKAAAEGKHKSTYVQDDPKLRHSSIFNHLSSYIKNTESATFRVRYISEIVDEQRKMAEEIDEKTLLSWFLKPQTEVPSDTKAQDIILTSCIKNEKNLQDWYEHYKQLGVTKFLIIDDHSETPVSRTLSKEDVYVWTPKCGQFRYSKAFWLEVLLLNFGTDKWCLTVDSDEYLALPQLLMRRNGDGDSSSPLQRFLFSITKPSKDYFCGFLLDMAPGVSAFEQLQSNPQRKLERSAFNRFQCRPASAAPAYHRHNTVKWSYGKHSQWAYSIDIRFRINGSIDSLRKFPIIKFNKGIHLNQGFHDLIINGDKRSFADLERTDLLPILHYKLHASQFDACDDTSRPAEQYHQDTAKNIEKLRKNIQKNLKQAAIIPFNYTYIDFWALPLPGKTSIELKVTTDSHNSTDIAPKLINREEPIPVIIVNQEAAYREGVIYAKDLEAAIFWVAQNTPFKSTLKLEEKSAKMCIDNFAPTAA